MAHELEYVVDNALMKCSEGTVPMFFHPTPRNIRVQGMKVANASDKTPITNIPSFVICQKLTRAAGGVPVPCVPVTATQTWQDTYPVKINGEKLVVFRCSIRCTSGQGKIEFMTSGQTPVGPADLAQLQQLQKEAEEALAEAEAEQNSVGEAGLAEGLIPIWGSGRDMIHSFQTGHWGWGIANAGFLAMDVVGVVAGVFTFGGATAVEMGLKTGLKAALGAGVRVVRKGLARRLLELTAKAALTKKALAEAMARVVAGRACVIACFPAGTLVAVEAGHKPIEDIEAGELVWSRHEETGALALQPVLTTMSRESDHLLHLRLGGERISTTVEHPFWVDRRGWVKAGELVLGDLILRADDAAVAVTEMAHETEFGVGGMPVVYNIEVGGWHNYLVGKWLWWVHNAGPCTKKAIEILLKGRTYLREVERITNLKIHPEQIKRLKEALRKRNYTRLSIEDTEKARAAFGRKKNKLIAEWERKTGQKWPRHTTPVFDKNGEIIKKVGDPYDAHHIIENTYGGEHEWWNIHPARFPDQHQGGIHGKGGPAGKVFPRKRK